MHTSDAIDKIAPALVKAQAELSPALKDSTNPHFKSKYADLSAVWAAVGPALKKHELMVLQDNQSNDSAVGVRTRIMHSSGQWIEFEPVIIPLTKRDAHGVGSALTYGRRYGLSAAIGVVSDDDDGAGAVGLGHSNGAPEAQVVHAKNPPGRHGVVTQVREMARDIHACTEADQLLALINADEFKKFAFRVCCDFPNDWLGPEDNSGLSGAVAQVGVNLKCQNETDGWVHRMEAARDKKLGHKQAAE